MSESGLQRFLDAQQEPMYSWVYEELRAGQKRGHWMWFIFPQAYGLGESHNSKLYGLRSLDEVKEYWDHPVLGMRLRECIQLAIDAKKSALELFDKEIDVTKFQSCLTLFLQIDQSNNLLLTALKKFFNQELDLKTMAIITKVNKAS